MKHIKLFEEFINEAWNGEIKKSSGGLNIPDNAKAALTKVIDKIFKKPKYKDMWLDGGFYFVGVRFKFKPFPDPALVDNLFKQSSLGTYWVTLQLSPDGFKINPTLEEEDADFAKHAGGPRPSTTTYEKAFDGLKISNKQINDTVKDLEKLLDKYIEQQDKFNQEVAKYAKIPMHQRKPLDLDKRRS